MASSSFPSLSPNVNPPTTTITKQFHSTSPISLLPRCRSFREIQQIHAFSIKTHLQFDIPTLAQLIKSCALHPTDLSMDYAQELFDTMPKPDVVVFNTMLRGYASTNNPIQAFALFSRGLEVGVVLDNYTFPSLIKACANSKELEEGKQAHSVAVKYGFHNNEFVVPTLINMYAECNDVCAAQRVFNLASSNGPCVFSYNSMITAFARSSRPSEAIVLFRRMQEVGLQPTYVTILSVLSSCALLGSLELGRWIHDYVKKNGFTTNVKVNTTLIDMYAKCGSLEDAVCVFEEMGYRDTQAWSSMIVAHAIHGHGDTATKIFEKMKVEGLRPDAITFLGLLYACSHSGLVEEGLQYFHSMRGQYGIIPGIKHYGCFVDLLARAGRLEEAYDFIVNLPINPTPILWRTLLSACGGRGNVELGKRVFERISELDDTHAGDYVIMSNMYATNGRLEDVDYIRKLMKDKGVVKVPGCSSIEVDNTVHEFFAGDGQHPQSLELRKMLDVVIEQLKLVGYIADTSQVFHLDMEEEEKEISLRYHSEKLAIGFGLINTPPGTTIRVVKNLRVCSDCHSVAKLISMVFDRKIILRDLNRFHHFADGECSCRDFW